MVLDNNDLDCIFKMAMEEADKDQREIHVIEILKYYLSHRPKHGRAWLCYAECLRLVGRYDDALDAFFNCLEFAPEKQKPDIYGRIGLLCSVFRSPLEAEDWFRLGTISENCADGWIWLLRGVNFMKLGRYKEALHCIETSSTFDDVDQSEVSFNRGLITRAMGKYDEAKKDFQEAILIASDYEEAKKCLQGLDGLDETRKISDRLSEGRRGISRS
jgi:tetratricopeptide (TPR) repeat protein